MKKTKTKKLEAIEVKKFIPGVLMRPVVTEKVVNLGLRAFRVQNHSNKKTVKEAVEKNLGLKVRSVRIVNVKPKPRRFRGIPGKKSGYKKAIVKVF